MASTAFGGLDDLYVLFKGCMRVPAGYGGRNIEVLVLRDVLKHMCPYRIEMGV